ADYRALGQHGDELGAHQVDLVDPGPFALAGAEVLDQPLGDPAGVGELGPLGVAAPLGGHVLVAEPVPDDALGAGYIRHRLDTPLGQRGDEGLGFAQHVRVVPAGEAAVTGEHDHGRALGVLRLG